MAMRYYALLRTREYIFMIESGLSSLSLDSQNTQCYRSRSQTHDREYLCIISGIQGHRKRGLSRDHLIYAGRMGFFLQPVKLYYYEHN
jgi:hypothetical protein